MAEPVLQINDLTAGYSRDLPILTDVKLDLLPGSLTVIIGPNGAGKSTLIKAIAGLLPHVSGKIALNGKSILGLRPDQLATFGVAYVPQTDNIFRSLTIRQNLDLVLRHAGGEAATRRGELFTQFPALEAKQMDKAGALSGGQRQMLAVAMALAVKPDVMLLDEPSAGLAPKAAQEVLELARELTTRGVSILLVEQNVKQALRIADHCYILAEGRNQLDGPAQDLLNDPVVGEIYLGGKRVEAS